MVPEREGVGVGSVAEIGFVFFPLGVVLVAGAVVVDEHCLASHGSEEVGELLYEFGLLLWPVAIERLEHVECLAVCAVLSDHERGEGSGVVSDIEFPVEVAVLHVGAGDSIAVGKRAAQEVVHAVGVGVDVHGSELAEEHVFDAVLPDGEDGSVEAGFVERGVDLFLYVVDSEDFDVGERGGSEVADGAPPEFGENILHAPAVVLEVALPGGVAFSPGLLEQIDAPVGFEGEGLYESYLLRVVLLLVLQEPVLIGFDVGGGGGAGDAHEVGRVVVVGFLCAERGFDVLIHYALLDMQHLVHVEMCDVLAVGLFGSFTGDELDDGAVAERDGVTPVLDEGVAGSKMCGRSLSELEVHTPLVVFLEELHESGHEVFENSFEGRGEEHLYGAGHGVLHTVHARSEYVRGFAGTASEFAVEVLRVSKQSESLHGGEVLPAEVLRVGFHSEREWLQFFDACFEEGLLSEALLFFFGYVASVDEFVGLLHECAHSGVVESHARVVEVG